MCYRRFSSYRLEVTVDYLFPVQHLQALEKCMSKATDESETEALEVVFFDELIQVNSVKRDKQDVFMVLTKHKEHLKT